MRIVLPDLRTLPSSTCTTPSALAISAIVVCFPLKKNDDVRAGTRRSEIFVSMSMSSSDSPSEKYSLFLSSLMLTNGSTATALSEMVLAAGTVPSATDATSVGGCSVVTCLDSQNLSVSRYATASTRTTT